MGALLAPRATRRQLVAGVLCAALGFAAVAAVRGNDQGGFLRTARSGDLVRLLDDLAQRQARLDAEAGRLEQARTRLVDGTEEAALAETRRRVRALAELAGTVPVEGPGVTVRVTDPTGLLDPATLVDAVQELRDAGARAMQIGRVRVVAGTWIAPGPGGRGMLVSGTAVQSPYVLLAVGDPQTLATALQIPGGFADTVRAAGATVAVTPRDVVRVDALQPLRTPQYARPAPTPAG